MKFLTALFLLACGSRCWSQTNTGELHLTVIDPSGRALQSSIHVLSQANQYNASLATGADGSLTVPRLPFGIYRLEASRSGFATAAETISIQSALPTLMTIHLKLAAVSQNVTVAAGATLLDPNQPGAVAQIGESTIQNRVSSIPGRSVQDLVNSQPGWLFEGNAVLHPRGSENQTQFILDGVPLTDNRSPGFGPQIDVDDMQSISIYTAGIPAEYGRKMGGIVELNTHQAAKPGLHGEVVLSGGSFDTAGGFGKAQYTWGRNTVDASADGSRTDHYLNPVVPQNYSNTGTVGDFSLGAQRSLNDSDRISASVRHEFAHYDIPNEQVQQAAGQRQAADSIETIGITSWQHIFSPHALADLRVMGRDNAHDFNSNTQATPIEIFQSNRFREGYVKATLTATRGPHEIKFGVESDNILLHENFRYAITDPDQYDGDTPLTFSFSGHRPDHEQSAFIEDLFHHGLWTLAGGLRWDHYQLLLTKQSIQPRVSIARYLPSAGMVVHFSYDRVFQTPSFDNILLSSSDQIESLAPATFLRLPVQPSTGDYYEVGLSKAFAQRLRIDANYFRRYEQNYADDDQIDNTAVSFPIAFRRAIIYGTEAKVELPSWGRFSGFASYSWQVGNVWNPVTGGLFLGDNATAAAQQMTGHFPISQDQRNTLRVRMRYQIHPRLWIAGGASYDSGLPFQFGGDPSTVLAQYGQQVLDRVNLERGRIRPVLQINASAAFDLHHSEKATIQVQADGENLTDVLDVIDFGGLFSGNAIGPSRSGMLRLTATF